jgi:hypothetical protein
LVSKQSFSKDITADTLQAIRGWLNAPDPSVNLNAAADKRTPGTGQWILELPEYQDWKSSPDAGKLWMTGKGRHLA